MTIHPHQILIIKNKNNSVLQYYDMNWNSYLFPNKKPNQIPYLTDIENYINNLFKVNDTECRYLGQLLHKKYSQKDKIIKEYQHFFYLISSTQLLSNYTNTEFELNNMKYKWFSLDELCNNNEIYAINGDIINKVKELINE